MDLQHCHALHSLTIGVQTITSGVDKSLLAGFDKREPDGV